MRYYHFIKEKWYEHHLKKQGVTAFPLFELFLCSSMLMGCLLLLVSSFFKNHHTHMHYIMTVLFYSYQLPFFKQLLRKMPLAYMCHKKRYWKYLCFCFIRVNDVLVVFTCYFLGSFIVMMLNTDVLAIINLSCLLLTGWLLLPIIQQISLTILRVFIVLCVHSLLFFNDYFLSTGCFLLSVIVCSVISNQYHPYVFRRKKETKRFNVRLLSALYLMSVLYYQKKSFLFYCIFFTGYMTLSHYFTLRLPLLPLVVLIMIIDADGFNQSLLENKNKSIGRISWLAASSASVSKKLIYGVYFWRLIPLTLSYVTLFFSLHFMIVEGLLLVVIGTIWLWLLIVYFCQIPLKIILERKKQPQLYLEALFLAITFNLGVFL